MKEDVKHINWTGPLTNERVPQSLIGWRKGVFVDCSNNNIIIILYFRREGTKYILSIVKRKKRKKALSV